MTASKNAWLDAASRGMEALGTAKDALTQARQRARPKKGSGTATSFLKVEVIISPLNKDNHNPR